jgi:vacuolar-type H+-ATPase subunit I/STV1
MVRAGTLRLDELPADERKVVMRMAEQIKANAVGDIEQMSDEQLDAMIARAKELKRARWALMKRLPSIERQRDKLIARRNALQKRIGELQQTIDGIREGKQVEVPAGPLKGRKLGPLSPAQLAQRHKAAERMRAARAAKAAKRKQEQAA